MVAGGKSVEYQQDSKNSTQAWRHARHAAPFPVAISSRGGAAKPSQRQRRGRWKGGF